MTALLTLILCACDPLAVGEAESPVVDLTAGEVPLRVFLPRGAGPAEGPSTSLGMNGGISAVLEPRDRWSWK